MKRFYGILCVLMVAAGAGQLAVTAGYAADAEYRVILKTDERLKEQERRQLLVSRNMDAAAVKINLLLADLAANQLMEKGRGEAVARMEAQLAGLNRTNVPLAVMSLGKAREDLKGAYPHLDVASREAAIIIRELDLMLKEAGAVLVLDVLIAQIQEVIRTEAFVKGETSQWGKQMFLNPKEAEVDGSRLANAQQEVLARYNSFGELLHKAVGEAGDENLRMVFSGAEEVISKTKPELLLRSAIAGLNEKKVISVADFQEKSLLAFQEIERILTTPVEVVPRGGRSRRPGAGGASNKLTKNPQMPTDKGRKSGTKAGGAAVAETESTDRALTKKGQDGAVRKFVQNVPPEFRKEVAEYFEVIGE